VRGKWWWWVREEGEISIGSQPVHSGDRDAKVTVTVTSREIQSTNKKYTATARPHIPTHTSYKPITGTNTTTPQRRRTRHPANRAVGPHDHSRRPPRCCRSHDRLHERLRQARGPHRWNQALCSYKLGTRSTRLRVWVGRLDRTSDPFKVSHQHSRSNRPTSRRTRTKGGFREVRTSVASEQART